MKAEGWRTYACLAGLGSTAVGEKDLKRGRKHANPSTAARHENGEVDEGAGVLRDSRRCRPAGVRVGRWV